MRQRSSVEFPSGLLLGARRACMSVAALVGVITAGGCRDERGTDPGSAIAALSVPDTSAYVSGPIERRLTDGRLLIRAADPVAAAARHRTASAVVNIRGAAIVRRSDGIVLRPSALQPGRNVSVWATGPELRSLPPQVQARVVVVER